MSDQPTLKTTMPDESWELAHAECRRLRPLLIATRWRHSKGGEYYLSNFDVDADTCGIRVEYCPLNALGSPDLDRRVSRPWNNWNENVDRDGYIGPRFVRVEDAKF